MPRDLIWTGTLSFGLVSIPVTLQPAEARRDLGFSMLDRRDMSPIGYRKINKNTGKDVPKDKIAKGFKIDQDRFVLVEDADFKRAAPERSQHVEIQLFVKAGEITPPFFHRPYYLEPAKKSEKAYVLLREAMKRTQKIGIATVVIRAKEYLTAIVPQGAVLLLELLRFSHELRDPSDLRIPENTKPKITEKELRMAERLIEDLAGPWRPEKFKDTYHDELLAMLRKKAESGKAFEAAPVQEKEERFPSPTDIMELLKRSVVHAERGHAGAHRTRYLH